MYVHTKVLLLVRKAFMDYQNEKRATEGGGASSEICSRVPKL